MNDDHDSHLGASSNRSQPPLAARPYDGHELLHDAQQLAAALGLKQLADLDDALEYQGDLVLDDEGVEFMDGRIGTVLLYPFTLAQLLDLATELVD